MSASCLHEGNIAEMIKDLGWGFPQPHWEKYHFSTKAGPNGLASISCFHDLETLSTEQLTSLKILGGEGFKLAIEKLQLFN